MDKKSIEPKQPVDKTTTPPALEGKTNEDTSKLESDQSKNQDESVTAKTVEQVEQELKEAQEATKRAENTIVKLKKQGFKSEEEHKAERSSAEEIKKAATLDVEAITKEIAERVKQELTPDLTKQAALERENLELKEILVSKQGTSNGSAPSVKESKGGKKQPSAKDVEQANRFFKGDVEKYMKYKTK